MGQIIIGVGAQSTLGGARHFCPKNMYEKLTKFPNFTRLLTENARILHKNCPNFFSRILGGTLQFVVNNCFSKIFNTGERRL